MPSPRPPPTFTRAQARLLWYALAVSLAAATAASALSPAILHQPPDPALGRILLPVAALVTAIDLAMAYVVTSSIRRRAAASGGSPEGAAGTQVIIATALAFGAALFSAVGHFITAEKLFLLFVLPCAAVFLHWFPSESRWERIQPGPTRNAAPGRRMMRE